DSALRRLSLLYWRGGPGSPGTTLLFPDGGNALLRGRPWAFATPTPAAVAGAQYPTSIKWPANVERIEHVKPAAHSNFYGKQSFTLNLTRTSMIHAGYSPSVRLFEAAACGCPVISDWWEGLDQFFKVDEEILVAD